MENMKPSTDPNSENSDPNFDLMEKNILLANEIFNKFLRKNENTEFSFQDQKRIHAITNKLVSSLNKVKSLKIKMHELAQEDPEMEQKFPNPCDKPKAVSPQSNPCAEFRSLNPDFKFDASNN